MVGFEVNKMSGPVKKYRAGAVSVALWENEIAIDGGQKVSVLKASIERRYKDSTGTWKSSTSFSRGEVGQAILCLARAYVVMNDDGDGHGARE